MKKNLLQAVTIGLTSLILSVQATAGGNNDLVYHGPLTPVERSSTTTNLISIYAIYWLPTSLQDNTPVSGSSNYVRFHHQFLVDIGGANGLSSIANQYYSVDAKKIKNYANARLLYTDEIVDTSPYPTTGCPESMLSSTNCLEDSDIQAKIVEIVDEHKWMVNSHTVFLVYTAKGEDVCDGNGNCTTTGTQFCGYHSAILHPQARSFLAYASLPYTGANGVGNCGTGSYPQNYPDAEAVANTAVSQIFATITNPLHNGWYTKNGQEIGDICKGVTASTGNTWANGTANHQWNGHFYSIQPLYDNHLHACVDSGS